MGMVKQNPANLVPIKYASIYGPRAGVSMANINLGTIIKNNTLKIDRQIFFSAYLKEHH